MTMNARRTGDRIAVEATAGPLHVTIDETPGHLRHFWSQLGRLLDEVEHQPV